MPDSGDPETDSQPAPPFDRLVAKATPGDAFAAQNSLATLEAKLFGRARAPVKVGAYVIEDRLGAGGSGTVYRAYDAQKDRKVALKLLHAGEGPKQASARARLLREAQTLAKLDHPNVVKVLDVGPYDPSALIGKPRSGKSEPGVFVAMEFVQGATLDQWLRLRPRGWREIRDVFLAAGRGIAAAHAKGLIHRDFKPANVIVSENEEGTVERVVVLDFGLARAIDKLSTSSQYGLIDEAKARLAEQAAPIDATLTAPGTLLGTPAYMAPEQHARGRGTALSDQYAFCLALYEAWYGHRPFFAETERALEQAKVSGDVMPPPVDTDVPPYLFRAVHRGLSADPDGRYPSIEELLDALSATDPKWRRRWVLAGVGVAAAAVATVLLWPSDPCDPDRDAWAEQVSTERRADVDAALRGTGLPYADATAQRVERRLDEYGDAWRGAWEQACADEPGDVPGPRRACLDDRRRVMATLLDALKNADATRTERAIDAVAQTPGPKPCLRTPPWYSVAAKPDEDGKDGTALHLARAEVFELLGAHEEAAEAAASALAAARQSGDQGRVALATLRHATARARLGRRAEAATELAEVLWSASGVEHHGLATAAATRLVEIAHLLDTPDADAPLWSQRARDAAARGDPGERAKTLVVLGRSLLHTGDPKRAVEDLRAARALVEEKGGAPSVLQVDVYETLGRAHVRGGDATSAVDVLRRATELARTVYGPDHPRTGLVRRALAAALAAAGEAAEATDERARAQSILDAALPPDDPRR